MQEMQVSQSSIGFMSCHEESLHRFSTQYKKLHATKSTLIFSKSPNRVLFNNKNTVHLYGKVNIFSMSKKGQSGRDCPFGFSFDSIYINQISYKHTNIKEYTGLAECH